MRFRVRLEVGCNWAPGFSRVVASALEPPHERRPLPQECAASRRKGFPRALYALKRKEDSSESPPRRGPVTWRRRVTRVPVPEFQPDSLSPVLLLTSAKKQSNPLGTRLGATHSCPIAVHTKPFSTSVYKGFTCMIATSTKICTGGPSTPASRRGFQS